MLAENNIKPIHLGIDSNSKKILSKVGKRPGDNYVIAYDSSRNPKSRYGEMVWDFSDYGNGTGHHVIKFRNSRFNNSMVFEQNIKIIKWMIFLYINYNTNGRGGVLSPGSISTLWKLSLKNLLEYCSNNNYEITKVFCNEKEFIKYVNNSKLKTVLPGLSSLNSLFRNLGESKSGITPISENILRGLRQKVKDEHDPCQTAVIPNRILSLSIKCNLDIIEEFISYEKRVISFFKMREKHGKKYGSVIDKRRIKPFYKRVKVHQLEFHEVMDKHNLDALCDKHNIRDTTHMSRYLKTVQYAAKTLIHAYTGMRCGESLVLNEDCLRIETVNEREVYRIVGETSKLEAVKKYTSWISSVNVLPAIEAARKIRNIVCMNCSGSSERLFPNTSDVLKPGKDRLAEGYKTFQLALEFQPHNVIIEKQDVEELIRFDPFMNFGKDEIFKVGSRWNFTPHQYRRSLAFYAAQSGLVSLPSLKRQLQHITKEMTIYYASRSSDPFNIFSDKGNHISFDFREIKPEADAIAMLYNLLLTDEKLYGPAGASLERQVKNDSAVNILDQRETMIKRFQKGLLAYKETPLGVCMSGMPCEKQAMRSITACLNCGNAVLRSKNVLRVYEAQSRLLKRLDKNTVEYKIEFLIYKDLKKINQSIAKGA